MTFDLNFGAQIDQFRSAYPTMSAIALIGTGAFLGFGGGWLWFRQEIAVYKARLDHADLVIAERLPASTYKPRFLRRGARMFIGLLLLGFGLLLALIGAVVLLFNIETKPLTIGAGRIDTSPSPKNSAPTTADPEKLQRESLLRMRGELELSVRDAGGIPITLPLPNQAAESLKIKDGDNEYELQASIAYATGAWIWPPTTGTKAFYVSKTTQRTPIDIRQLRPSRGSDTISIGQRAFVELDNGRVIQLLLTGVLFYRAGDDRDELRFKYKVYGAGEFLIDPL